MQMREIKDVYTIDEVNDYLARGWVYLGLGRNGYIVGLSAYAAKSSAEEKSPR